MKNFTGYAALIQDLLNEPTTIDNNFTEGFEKLLYWHSALEAVQNAIESTIDYIQFEIGKPEDFAFDWYVAALKFDELSNEAALSLSSDDSIAFAYGICQLDSYERAQFVLELYELWEEINQSYQGAQPISNKNQRIKIPA